MNVLASGYAQGHHEGVQGALGEAWGLLYPVGMGALAGLRRAAPASLQGEVEPRGSPA